MKIIKEVTAAQNSLTYSLTADNAENGTEVYGIAVASKLFGKAERTEITDITSEFSLAERLLYLLADNIVLPSCFRETVEDYVAAQATV